jgi:beta-glucosidase/6-phospho-beta-glucosidase/beta-galactosidase
MLTAKGLGATHYRMSIAWTRIFPNGDGAINQPGVDHYSEQIDFAIAIGLEPVLTCYHWDLPQVEALNHPLQ